MEMDMDKEPQQLDQALPVEGDAAPVVVVQPQQGNEFEQAEIQKHLQMQDEVAKSIHMLLGQMVFILFLIYF
jgi:hypothetical protein